MSCLRWRTQGICTQIMGASKGEMRTYAKLSAGGFVPRKKKLFEDQPFGDYISYNGSGSEG